jgi:Uma2 family endonuclease
VIKLREYQAVQSIRRYVLVDLDAGAVTLHARNHDSGPFRTMELAGTDMLKLPEIGIEIPVAAIYERRDSGQDATP